MELVVSLFNEYNASRTSRAIMSDQTSEAELQQKKKVYEEIVQILLSAGYFRVRIASLSEFDKVVGGLCWCITSSGEDVDVDILFQENSTIGQRISLSESIVKALRLMKCPEPLQPHQIQGGIAGADYPAIHPVIVWLIKKFFARRDEREAVLRQFSTLQFSKNYQLPSEPLVDFLSKDMSKILQRNKAVRKYRRSESKRESEITRIHSCLLEYGESFVLKGSSNGSVGGSSTLSSLGTSSSSDMSGFDKKLAQMAKEAQKEEQLFAEHAKKEEEELMTQMAQMQGDGAVSGSQVGSIVGLTSGEIGSAAAAYQAELDEAKRLMESNLANGKLGQAAAYTRQKENILKMKEEVDEKAAETHAAMTVILEKLRGVEHQRDEAFEYNEKLNGLINKMNELEAASTQQDEIKILKQLVTLNESMKAQEAAFKASCKAQLHDFTAKIKALDDGSVENEEEEKKLADIEDMHGKIMAKYNRLRQLLAETNLELANSSRIIDDIPTRTELIQYERRFVELYQQVSWKLEETRKYYALYNTLDTTLTFLQKEVTLLDSISSNFTDAMKSTKTKAEYLNQLDLIVRGVDDSLARQEGQLASQLKVVDDLKTRHQALVDEQRRYFKTVKDFQAECDKNDWLSQKLEVLESSQQ